MDGHLTADKEPFKKLTKVNAFKDSFEQMNIGEEQNSCLEIQALNVIPYRVISFNIIS